jgi:hypothetical protein
VKGVSNEEPSAAVGSSEVEGTNQTDEVVTKDDTNAPQSKQEVDATQSAAAATSTRRRIFGGLTPKKSGRFVENHF